MGNGWQQIWRQRHDAWGSVIGLPCLNKLETPEEAGKSYGWFSGGPAMLLLDKYMGSYSGFLR